jgi:hypothetical protein
MAKSPSVGTKPAPAPTHGGAPERMGPSLPPLKVTYYKRMKRQRVYAVTATWHNPEKRRPPAGAGPVVVRLLMAGAQVVPSEQPLDASKPDAKAVFYVTPLARGWLRHECMEILVGGRKVQEMPLATNVTSQRLTWVLLLLTILVPWALLHYIQHSPLSFSPEREKDIKKTVGEVLAKRIAKSMPETPGYVKDYVPWVHDGLVSFRENVIGDGFTLLWNVSQHHPLPHYAAIAFLFLTILSWFMHRDRRKRRYGKPVPVGAGSAEPLADVADEFA